MDLIPAVLVSWAQHSRQTQGLSHWKICPRTSPQVGQVLAQHCQVPGEVGNEAKRKSAGNFGNYGKKSIESYCQVVTSWLNWTEFFEVYMTQIVMLNPELYLKSSPIVASIHKNACKMKAYSSLVAMLLWCWISLSFLAMIGSHPSICHFHCYLIHMGVVYPPLRKLPGKLRHNGMVLFPLFWLWSPPGWVYCKSSCGSIPSLLHQWPPLMWAAVVGCPQVISALISTGLGGTWENRQRALWSYLQLWYSVERE